MFRHLIRLVWNRKRSNGLVAAEIFVTYLVLFGVLTAVFHSWSSFRGELGFSIQDVWSVEISRHAMALVWDPSMDQGFKDEDRATLQRLIQELESLGPVQAVAGSSQRPYSSTIISTVLRFQGRDIRCEFSESSDRFAEVLQLKLVAGRWFEPSDSALGWEPVVINPELSRKLFGDADPLGRRIEDGSDSSDRRVVGVVKAFRHLGELSTPGPFMFVRNSWDPKSERFPDFLELRMKPGTPAGFEETLAKRLETIAPRWTFTVSRLEAYREAYFRDILIPGALMGMVVAFLLIMVILGLTGVMWQNVIRRTREIGLRRALGADAGHIHRQIVVEVMILAAFAIAAGAAIALQVPLLGPFSNLAPKTALAGAFGAGVLMLIFAAACGLYPGWLATRVRPVDALHFE